MAPFLISFVVVALAEMGDKTQLVAFSLASRYRRPWTVLLGILAATLLNHALAASAGAWVASRLSERGLSALLAASFLVFGVWALIPDRAPQRSRRPRWGPLASTALIFFLAEMGDKTQLATAALGARFEAPVLVAGGTTLGMLAADGLAVFAGTRLAAAVPLTLVRRLAAGLFFLFGFAALLRALALV